MMTVVHYDNSGIRYLALYTLGYINMQVIVRDIVDGIWYWFNRVL